MARKVILDVDPGIDDAVALCLALFDPRLEVLAVTAVGGNVAPDQANRNVQAVIEQLDPPRWPRIGAASWPEEDYPTDNRHIFGSDGLGEADFQVAELHHLHTAEKVLSDEIRNAPNDVTVITLGPLTNLANAFRRDPALSPLIRQIVIGGGTVAAPGNVTPAAEFNFYSDPKSAREVLRTRATKTLVPLDVTCDVSFSLDLLNQLPDEDTKAGKFLRRMLPFAFRSYRERLGMEGLYLHAAVTLAAVVHPELFTTHAMAGDVETSGELTAGASVFDRRPHPEWRSNIDVAVALDVVAVKDFIFRGLQEAGRAG